MKKNFYFLLLVLSLTLATLACGLVSGSDEPVSPESESAPGPADDILFSDDFSNPNSGWDQVNSSEGVTDYANGVYRIFVNTDNTDVWANPSLNFTDTIIEVEATKVGGPDDNDFGIQCRYQDTGNFYFFIISSDGFYGIGITQDGTQSLLGADKLQPSDDINLGNTTNNIRVDCVGNTLTLFVNGTQLISVQDDTFASGDVGLLAGTYDEIGTDIHFDNFVVTAP
jgi:hypothetical protein